MLPEMKVPKREMPSSAVKISETALNYPHVTIAANDGASESSTSMHHSTHSTSSSSTHQSSSIFAQSSSSTSSSSHLQASSHEEGSSSPEGPRTTSSFFVGSNERTVHAVEDILSHSHGGKISQTEVNTAINAASGIENLPGSFPASTASKADEGGSFFGGGGGGGDSGSFFSKPGFEDTPVKVDEADSAKKDFPDEDSLSPTQVPKPAVRFG